MGREGEQLLALPGPCPCSSCGGVLLVPPVGSGAGWPQQRENVSQVRGCPARQACLSDGEESGQWLVQEYSRGAYFVDESAVAAVFLWVATVPCLCHVVVLTLPSSCVPVPPARYNSATGLACLTLLVVEGVPLMSLGHTLRSTLPLSIDYFVPLSTSETLKQSWVWTSSSKASAVRWLRKGGQSEHPHSREKRPRRSLCIHPEGWSEEDKDQVLLLVKSQAVNRFKLQKENSSLKIKKII